MKRLASLLLATLLFLSPLAARAEVETKPDDQVVFDLAAENWVTTKTARISLSVEAAVTGSAAGTMRAAMMKAVGEVAKADWRLIGFNRLQDQTGMERWSAQYEARLPENELGGLQETAKKVSKPGMQISVASVDFSPTLEEIQAVLAQTRAQIYKQASEQLAALNAALPGRAYRIGMIDFVGDGPVPMRTFNTINATMARAAVKASGFGGAPMELAQAPMPSMERSQKITLTARVVLSAPPQTPAK